MQNVANCIQKTTTQITGQEEKTSERGRKQEQLLQHREEDLGEREGSCVGKANHDPDSGVSQTILGSSIEFTVRFSPISTSSIPVSQSPISQLRCVCVCEISWSYIVRTLATPAWETMVILYKATSYNFNKDFYDLITKSLITTNFGVVRRLLVSGEGRCDVGSAGACNPEWSAEGR